MTSSFKARPQTRLGSAISTASTTASSTFYTRPQNIPFPPSQEDPITEYSITDNILTDNSLPNNSFHSTCSAIFNHTLNTPIITSKYDDICKEENPPLLKQTRIFSSNFYSTSNHKHLLYGDAYLLNNIDEFKWVAQSMKIPCNPSSLSVVYSQCFQMPLVFNKLPMTIFNNNSRNFLQIVLHLIACASIGIDQSQIIRNISESNLIIPIINFKAFLVIFHHFINTNLFDFQNIPNKFAILFKTFHNHAQYVNIHELYNQFNQQILISSIDLIYILSTYFDHGFENKCVKYFKTLLKISKNDYIPKTHLRSSSFWRRNRIPIIYSIFKGGIMTESIFINYIVSSSDEIIKNNNKISNLIYKLQEIYLKYCPLYSELSDLLITQWKLHKLGFSIGSIESISFDQSPLPCVNIVLNKNKIYTPEEYTEERPAEVVEERIMEMNNQTHFEKLSIKFIFALLDLCGLYTSNTPQEKVNNSHSIYQQTNPLIVFILLSHYILDYCE